jgi:hypothetical protein
MTKANRFAGLEIPVLLAAALLLLFMIAPEVMAQLQSPGPPNYSAGRNGLAAHYQVSNVKESGTNVRLTLEVGLTNPGEAALTNAVVTVRGSVLMPRTYASFPAMSLSAHQTVRLSREITVPLREYHHWQRGACPMLIIDFQDAAGKPVRRTVQLIRGPFGKGE